MTKKSKYFSFNQLKKIVDYIAIMYLLSIVTTIDRVSENAYCFVTFSTDF